MVPAIISVEPLSGPLTGLRSQLLTVSGLEDNVNPDGGKTL